MSEKKDAGQRKFDRLREAGETPHCLACGRDLAPSQDGLEPRFSWVKTKRGPFIFVCHDCAVRLGVAK